MSRTALLQEQKDWVDLLACRGWARLCETLTEAVKDTRQTLEHGETPEGVTFARALGRLDIRKEIAGDQATDTMSYPAKRMAEIEDELKKEASNAG